MDKLDAILNTSILLLKMYFKANDLDQIKHSALKLDDRILPDSNLELVSKNLPFDISTLEQALLTLKELGHSFYHEKLSQSTQSVSEWVQKSVKKWKEVVENRYVQGVINFTDKMEVVAEVFKSS